MNLQTEEAASPSESVVSMSELRRPLRQKEAREKAASTSIRLPLILFAIFIAAGLAIIAYSEYKRHHNPPVPDDPLERALYLLQRNPLIDGHNDLAWQFRLFGNGIVTSKGAWDLRTNLTDQGIQTDIPRLNAGLVGGQFWSTYVRCGMHDAVRVTLEQIDIAKSFIAKYSEKFQLATRSDQIGSIFRSGRIASFLGMEGGHQIDSSVAALRAFYDAGVRYMTLTHNCNTPWSESCCDSNPAFPTIGLTNDTTMSHGGRVNGSLSGLRVIEEMNRIGMMIDLSHVSANTMRDALRHSKAPVMFSHSSVYELVANPRNAPTDVLQMLHANGGILMITFYNNFTYFGPQAGSGDDNLIGTLNNVSYIADHFDAARRIMGGVVDNIGIGGDFDGNDLWGQVDFPVGMKDVSCYPTLIAELIRRGYTDEEVVAIMGGNIQRVLQQVEQVALDLQTAERSTFDVQEENKIYYDAPCRSNF